MLLLYIVAVVVAVAVVVVVVVVVVGFPPCDFKRLDTHAVSKEVWLHALS